METPQLAPRRQIALILLALGVTLPGVGLRLSSQQLDPILAAVLYGIAIVGAAFMISWAAEIIQLDIGGGLALALLALIAVLPEYAVDFVLTADAGREFARTGSAEEFGPRALANMTGANQLLIGFGWPLVILLGTWRVRRTGATPQEAELATPTSVNLSRAQSVDIAYLAIASIYGMSLFLKKTLSPLDAVILVGIYVAYMIRLSGATPGDPHLVGPSAYIGAMPKTRRRVINYVLFVVSALVIVLVAEQFAESLIEVGAHIGVSDFLLLKWLAPFASEAPELLIATLFAWRLAARTGIGALISSKVNQWTLLVGTLPIVFMIFAGQVHGLPLNEVQRDELWVTATQSVFAVAIIAGRSISWKEATAMLALFIVQLAESWFAEVGIISEDLAASARIGVGVMFLLAAIWVLRRDFRLFVTALRDGFTAPWGELEAREEYV
ncbi:MAG TPA: sodium:proton exchanger [Acidimicrobiia bacterium]|nr:sodium:proton exchanger [Acidimicrobiia bacterium]